MTSRRVVPLERLVVWRKRAIRQIMRSVGTSRGLAQTRNRSNHAFRWNVSWSGANTQSVKSCVPLERLVVWRKRVRMK